MYLPPALASDFALEATASYRTFGKLGFSALESLRGRASAVSGKDRVATETRHRLGLEAMNAAISDAASDERNEDRRKILRSAAELLSALSRSSSLSAVETRAQSSYGPSQTSIERIIAEVRKQMAGRR
jgi:hypothetical protein